MPYTLHGTPGFRRTVSLPYTSGIPWRMANTTFTGGVPRSSREFSAAIADVAMAQPGMPWGKYKAPVRATRTRGLHGFWESALPSGLYEFLFGYTPAEYYAAHPETAPPSFTPPGEAGSDVADIEAGLEGLGRLSPVNRQRYRTAATFTFHRPRYRHPGIPAASPVPGLVGLGQWEALIPVATSLLSSELGQKPRSGPTGAYTASDAGSSLRATQTATQATVVTPTQATNVNVQVAREITGAPTFPATAAPGSPYPPTVGDLNPALQAPAQVVAPSMPGPTSVFATAGMPFGISPLVLLVFGGGAAYLLLAPSKKAKRRRR